MKIKELRKICQSESKDLKTLKGRFYRSFSIYITKLLIKTPITANQITISEIFLGLLIFILFATGDYILSILAFVFFELFILLDTIDGEVARYKKTASTKGAFLEAVVEVIMMPLVFSGITIGVYQHKPDLIFIIFGISAIFFSFYSCTIQNMKYGAFLRKLIDYSQGKNLDELANKIIKGQKIQNNKDSHLLIVKKIFGALLRWVRGTNAIYLILLAAIFNYLHLVILLYGILLPIFTIIILINEIKVGTENLEYLFEPYIPKK